MCRKLGADVAIDYKTEDFVAVIKEKTGKPAAPRKTPISRRRKIAAWNLDYLAAILQAPVR